MASSRNRARIFTALESIRTYKTASRLHEVINLVASDDDAIRWSAVETLTAFAGGARASAIHPHLTMAANDRDALVRSVAVEGLGRLRSQKSVPLLKRLLACDPSWIVRASAAEALAEIADRRALSALVAALKDRSPPVRAYAAYAIGLLAPAGESSVRRLRRAALIERFFGTKCDLYCAAYRLGARDALDSLLDLAKRVKSASLTKWLNTINDLVSRKRPRSLSSELDRITDRLRFLERRFPEDAAAIGAVRKRVATGARRARVGMRVDRRARVRPGV